MTPRDVKPIVSGFPGLPKWLDLPHIKRVAKEYNITESEAREHLRLNTLSEIEKRNSFELRTETSISVDRKSFQSEPQDAPENSE